MELLAEHHGFGAALDLTHDFIFPFLSFSELLFVLGLIALVFLASLFRQLFSCGLPFFLNDCNFFFDVVDLFSLSLPCSGDVLFLFPGECSFLFCCFLLFLEVILELVFEFGSVLCLLCGSSSLDVSKCFARLDERGSGQPSRSHKAKHSILLLYTLRFLVGITFITLGSALLLPIIRRLDGRLRLLLFYDLYP